MAQHPVSEIADAFVSALVNATPAGANVYRDREPALDVREELPAIVVRIGEDDPVDDQVITKWRSDVRINVDLYATAAEESLSAALLELRLQTHKRIMTLAPFGLRSIVRVLPGGAEEVLRVEGAGTAGALRCAWFVRYQHSLADPSIS